MRHFITIILFIAFAFVLFCASAYIATAQQSSETSVTVVIIDEVSSASVTASVPCNEVNCTEEEVEESWWEGIKSWFAGLWVF